VSRVKDLIAKYTDKPELGLLSEPRLNMLRLNMLKLNMQTEREGWAS
jgi:K+-transporting ATPase c subunit